MSDEPTFIKTILLVEDDSVIASRLSELLAQQAASQVILVSGCLTTFKFLHSCTPDLILLEDRLLQRNGIELGPRLAVMKDLQIFRSLYSTRIVLRASSRNAPEERRRAIDKAG